MLTLAVTGTVALTVEPEEGDVTVTIRLPIGSGIGSGGSICATASGGIPPNVNITSRAAA